MVLHALRSPTSAWYHRPVEQRQTRSRCLLACHFTPSYRAHDVTAALDAARAKAERHHAPLQTTPFLVTDSKVPGADGTKRGMSAAATSRQRG